MTYANTRQSASARRIRRTTHFIGLFLLLTMLLSLFLSISTFAAEPSVSEADGLTVSILTDKDNYESGDEVHILVTVQNNNIYDVEGLSIDNLIPDGFLLRTGAESYSNITVPAGEVYEATIITLYVEEDETRRSDKKDDDDDDFDRDYDDEGFFAGLISTLLESEMLPYILIGTAGVAIIAVVVVIIVKRKGRISRHFCFFLAFVLLMQVAVPVISAIEPSDTSLEVQKSVTFNGKPLDLAATVTWPKEAIVIPEIDESTYTRGQWLSMLAEKFGVEVNSTITADRYFYGDSADSTLGPLVETFHVLGVLPAPDSEGYEDPAQDIPLFEAERLVTREYAAVTIARLLGFEGEYTCQVADAEALTYPNEVGVMLMLNFFTPDAANCFLPDALLTAYDVLRANNRMDTYIDDETTDEGEADAEEKNYLALQNGTTHIENQAYTVTEQEDETYIVTLTNYKNSASLTEGSIIVLSRETALYEYALKIQSIDKSGETITLTCTKPELDEVLLEIDYGAPVDPTEINVSGSDGVMVEYDPNGSTNVGDEVDAFDISHNKGIPGKLNFIIEKELGDSGVKVTGSVKVAFPSITTRVRGKLFFGLSLDEVTVKLNQEIGIEAALAYDFGIPENAYDVLTGDKTFGTGKTEIGRASFPIGAGLHADIVFFINFDVAGQLKISYELRGTSGFQYKNKAFRAIKDYSSQFTTLEINAEAKLGIGVSPRISLFSVFDLAGIALHGGIGVYGGFVVHSDTDPVLHCGDLSAYFYLTMELDDDTIIVSILKKYWHITWSWEIFNKDNSPLSIGLHIENGKRVDECTYGKGGIFGLVKNAATGEPIGGARVQIYNAATGVLVTTCLTERVDLLGSELQLYRGEFQVNNLPAGLYRVDVQATGYQAYSIQVNVTPGNLPVVCEAALMLMRTEIEGNGFIQGDVINALTGMPLEGTTCIIRKGWNMTEGDIQYESLLPGSFFSVELAPGNYTIQLTKEEFIDSYINVVVLSDEVTIKNVTVSPKQGVEMQGGGFRVVLTWGEHPLDVDSYLICRNADGELQYFTYFGNQSSYNYDGDRIANLDVDDRYSYGPETSTVYEITEGCVYSFWVHDYTNRHDDPSTALSYSGAQVKLYSGEILLATFNIRENRPGTVWRVFEYDSATEQFTYLNEMGYSLLPRDDIY